MENLEVNRRKLTLKLSEFVSDEQLESKGLGEVYFMLTLKCNLQCRFCSWWGANGTCRDNNFLKKHAPDLTLGQLKRFADQIIPFGPKSVTLSGGEPLIHKKWYSIAHYFKKKGVKVMLTTNGTKIVANIEKISKVVDQINLSINDNDIFNFNRVYFALKELTNLKKNNGNKPNLKILYTISDFNYAYISKFIEFMEKSKIKIDGYIFQHLMFINRDNYDSQKRAFLAAFGIQSLDIWKGFVYQPEKINFKRFKSEIKRARMHTDVSFSPDLAIEEVIPYYKFNRGSIHYERYCTAPWHQLNILPDGSIYICPDYFIGNIKDNSFMDIWNGQKAQRLRAYITKKLFSGCKGCFYYYSDRSS